MCMFTHMFSLALHFAYSLKPVNAVPVCAHHRNVQPPSRQPLSTSAVCATYFDEIRRAHTFPANSFSEHSANVQHPTHRSCQYSDESKVECHAMKGAIKITYFSYS